MILAFFFWGMIALVFFGIWSGTLLLFIMSRSSPSRVRRWLGILPFAGMNFCIISQVAAFYYFSTPPQVFRSEFGFAPTADVREIQSQTWQFGDIGTTYLKFKAKPQTIKRIAKMGLQPEPISQAGHYTFAGSDMPEWWEPRSSTLTHLCIKKNRLRNFDREEEMLCYDERTEQAYYSFTGVD